MIDGQLLLKKNNEQKRIFFFFKVADFYPETGCQLIELFIWWGSQNERQTARNKKNVSTTAQPYIYAHLHACVWNPAPGVALAVPNNEVSSTNSLLPVWRYRFNPIAATRICPSDFSLTVRHGLPSEKEVRLELQLRKNSRMRLLFCAS